MQSRIENLIEQVTEAEDTFVLPSDGFIINNEHVNIPIPLGNGLSLPTKWVKRLGDRRVTAFTSQQGGSDLLYITEVYAEPFQSVHRVGSMLIWLE